MSEPLDDDAKLREARALVASENGKVGGKTTGHTKSRGDADHYRTLASKRARCGRTYRYPVMCSRLLGHAGECSGDLKSEVG